VPRPIAHASSARVLTMTRIDGVPLAPHLDALTAAGKLAERDALLAALVAEVAAQILVRGHVHADPHPGNIFALPDGTLALLDFGCTLTLSAAERGGPPPAPPQPPPPAGVRARAAGARPRRPQQAPGAAPRARRRARARRRGRRHR